MPKPFNTLALFYQLLESVSGFVTTEPPSDLTQRLPALIIESNSILAVSNRRRPGAGATVTIALTALAADDESAFELMAEAYTLLWESTGRRTDWGWVTSLTEIQAPTLVSSSVSAQGVYQYSAAVRAVIRK